MLTGLGTFLAIVLFVMAHEAGHFAAAKATGMKATEFFFGFGPRLWSFRRGETEYGVKLLPFGGYVRIVGMNPMEQVAPEDLGRTYREKKFWQKSVVVLAGVGTNFLIAYVMFFGILVFDGIPEPTTTIAVVAPELDGGRLSPAAAAGLQVDDRIVAIDGQPTETWSDVSTQLAAHPDERVALVVRRDEQDLTFQVTLASRLRQDTGEVVGFLGVGPQFVDVPVGAWSAAGLAGRQVGGAVGLTFEFLGRLIQPQTLGRLFGAFLGDTVPDDIRPVSPIGLVNIGSQADQIGFDTLFTLLASTNIILATLNVLPLYPLDGGHFALAAYERVTGRHADIRKLMPVAAAVIALVAFLGLVALVLDITNPIEL